MSADDDLVEATADFVDLFELVFDKDWEMTRSILADPEHFIDPDGTFLEPEIDDESNNWGNRGSLLASHRRLRTLLNKRGIPRPFK